MEQPNLSYIHSMSGGDTAFEQKLIAIIKEEFPQEKEIYAQNINTHNFKAAAGNVHKLKHKISILGLVNSYETAAQFENNLTEGHKQGQQEFEAVLQLITDFLETL